MSKRLIVPSGRQRRPAVRVRPQMPPNRHHFVGHRLREGPLPRRLHEGGGVPRLDREDRPQILNRRPFTKTYHLNKTGISKRKFHSEQEYSLDPLSSLSKSDNILGFNAKHANILLLGIMFPCPD